MYPIVVAGLPSGGRHVRCYCNLPACVTTSYMCKSPRGGCYSELVQDVRWARHGCIDEDPNIDLSTKCMNSPGRATGALGSSLLLCCFSDLCNHVDNPLAKVRINDSLSGANNLSGFSGLAAGGGSAPNTATDGVGESPGELWFRAATIAVPICGALILFFLIAVAIRILRTDTLDASHKLSAAYVHHGSAQGPLEQPLMKKSPVDRAASAGHHPPVHAPLLLSHANATQAEAHRDRFIAAKNEENAKMNLAASSDTNHPREDTYIIMQHCPQAQSQPPHSSPAHKPSNRDVNINIAPTQADSEMATRANTKLYEKQRLPPDDKLYNKEAIRYWGQAASNINHCPR